MTFYLTIFYATIGTCVGFVLSLWYLNENWDDVTPFSVLGWIGLGTIVGIFWFPVAIILGISKIFSILYEKLMYE